MCCLDQRGLLPQNSSLALSVLAWPAAEPASAGQEVVLNVTEPLPGLYDLSYSLPKVRPALTLTDPANCAVHKCAASGCDANRDSLVAVLACS